MDDENFTLSNFLTDSLNLKSNVNPSTRGLFRKKHENIYSKMFEKDPSAVLGIEHFTEQNKIPEDEIGSPIQEFYRGAHILITGATGFVGKALTEKLVRSIPHLGHVYLLIRPKKGKDAQERLVQLLEEELFRRMRTEVPWYLSKITAVEGDISQPDLGLSAVDRQLLTDKVHVVFHSAADVRFLEPLRVAIHSNLLGSRRVLVLAKQMIHLKAFVHVSTAYSQCVHRVIPEAVPKVNIPYQDVLQYLESQENQTDNESDSKMMQGWPNTYTFSKALCEDMLQEEAGDVPVCIFRPSIVWPSYKEPMRGWTDNIYGPTGLMLAAGLGVLHSFRMNKELGLDTVPVDYTVNCIIAVGWATSVKQSKTLPVYNFTSSPLRHWHWKVLDDLFTAADPWSYKQSIWYLSFITTQSYFLDGMAHIFLHKLPGYVLDKIAVLMNQEPRLTTVYKRIETVKPALEYFLFNTWEFQNDNLLSLWNVMDQKDKDLFWFDIRDVDILEYLLIGKLGLRYFYLKEKMDTIPEANRKNYWLWWAHTSLKVVSGLVLLKVAVSIAHILPL